MMEPTDYQAIRAALGRELDYAASFLNREFADDLVRFSKLLPPGEATALSDSVLRSLETGPPPDLATTVIDVFLRLKGVAERGNQALVDALKWPTLRTEVRSALIGALASRTSEDPKKLQQFNRWQFAEWARGKGLDVRTLRVPAQ